MLVHSKSSDLSVGQQCQLLGISRSSYYYQPKGESAQNLQYMRLIDEQYLKTPFFGYRQMTRWLNRQGYPVNRKRIGRLMSIMGLQGAVPGPHTSKPHPEHKIYPYLLNGLVIDHANQVWCADITYSAPNLGRRLEDAAWA